MHLHRSNSNGAIRDRPRSLLDTYYMTKLRFVAGLPVCSVEIDLSCTYMLRTYISHEMSFFALFPPSSEKGI